MNKIALAAAVLALGALSGTADAGYNSYGHGHGHGYRAHSYGHGHGHFRSYGHSSYGYGHRAYAPSYGHRAYAPSYGHGYGYAPSYGHKKVVIVKPFEKKVVEKVEAPVEKAPAVETPEEVPQK